MSLNPGKAKKVVNKDELRRLMKAGTGKFTQDKRIDSPLAKYNSLGQLSCVVCNCLIKTEQLWNAHILGKAHKENVVKLKMPAPISVVSSSKIAKGDNYKRKADNDDLENGIHSKVSKMSSASSSSSSHSTTVSSSLPSDFFDSKKLSSSKTSSYTGKAPKSILKNRTAVTDASTHSLTDTGSSKQQLKRLVDTKEPEDDSSNDSDSSTERMDISSSEDHTTDSLPSAVVSQLPSDFFDDNVKVIKTEEKKIPEGFFDDPKMDAKVRQVPYRDKMEEEWESFQKIMKVESTVSEQLLEEDDDERDAQRNISEINDQISRWYKIDSLQRMKEGLSHRPNVRAESADSKAATSFDDRVANEKGLNADLESKQDSDDEISDSDLNELMDWRCKKAWT